MAIPFLQVVGLQEPPRNTNVHGINSGQFYKYYLGSSPSLGSCYSLVGQAGGLKGRLQQTSYSSRYSYYKQRIVLLVGSDCGI